jgi:hypothetical protein
MWQSNWTTVVRYTLGLYKEKTLYMVSDFFIDGAMGLCNWTSSYMFGSHVSSHSAGMKMDLTFFFRKGHPSLCINRCIRFFIKLLKHTVWRCIRYEDGFDIERICSAPTRSSKDKRVTVIDLPYFSTTITVLQTFGYSFTKLNIGHLVSQNSSFGVMLLHCIPSVWQVGLTW